jgi:hypothetical protein
MSNPTDYEPCPVCGLRRWRGLVLPICETCSRHYLSAEWHALHTRLHLSGASISVMLAVNAAMLADVRELIESANHHRPFRS